MLDQVEKSLNDQLEKTMAEWVLDFIRGWSASPSKGSDNLVGIWLILQTPQWGDDGPYLDEEDITTLKKYVLELKSEIANERKDE